MARQAVSGPMRILYISLNQPWRGGGTFYRAFGFARHLVRRGHDVTLLATSRQNRWRFRHDVQDGVRLIEAPALMMGMLRSGWDPYEIVRRCLHLRNVHFDLIHGFESRPVVIYPALFLQRRHEATLILDWCDWFGRGGHVEERAWWLKPWLRPIETFYEEHFRTLADGTTVINTPLQRRASDLGVPPETIHLLPNGADVEMILPLQRLQARQELGLPVDEIILGHVGQVYAADLDLMLASFQRVRATKPRARLLLIGNHKVELENIAGYGNILSSGYVTAAQLNLYLAACDLMWLPLMNTGMNQGRLPMKINDYMSAGRATVSTGVGDLARLFQGQDSIGALASDDPVSFAETTLRLLADDQDRRRLERSARRVAESKFDWRMVTGDLEAFYREMMSQRQAARGTR